MSESESDCSTSCGYGCHKRTVLLSGDVYYKSTRDIAESGSATESATDQNITTTSATSSYTSYTPVGITLTATAWRVIIGEYE